MKACLLRAALVFGLILGAFPVHAYESRSSAPDWAEKMLGQWRGEGVRKDLATGRKTLVTVEVRSEWRTQLKFPALVSKNSFKEETLDSSGAVTQVREYERVYWMRETSREESRAEIILGGGEDSSTNPSSSGSYDSLSQLMVIQQELGLGTRVNSTSDLSQDGVTFYQEMFWNNGRKKTFSEITYSRLP
ncbi:MAG: hypothetical protein KGQ59_01925 [Bdellovibrionales bacterium]|nr:hypothetical protein [Bdellovibrionales bacterium]